MNKENNNEIVRKIIKNMVVAIILFPLVIVAILGITGYLIYRLVLYDYFCNRSVNGTLREFRKINKISKYRYTACAGTSLE